MLPMGAILRHMILIWAVEGASTWFAPPNHFLSTQVPASYNYLYLASNFLVKGTKLRTLKYDI
jgi:hypothetical protein